MNARTALLIVGLLAGGPASAEQFSSSRGVHRLPAVSSLSTDDSARQAEQAADTVLGELLLDVDASERERLALKAQVDAIAAQRSSEQAAVDQARSKYDELDRKYKTDYAAFEQRKSELEAEVSRQREEAMKLEPLPSAQRDRATVERLERWVSELNARRATLVSDADALLAAHGQVEAARPLAENIKAGAEAKLALMRDAVQGKLGAHFNREKILYAQLKAAVDYMSAVRTAWREKRTAELPHSQALEQARSRLRAFDHRMRP